MNFTKGKWRTEYRKTADGMYSQEVFDVNGETIATLAWHPVYSEDCKSITTDRQANAHLIASAPALYEALKAIIDGIDGRTERLGIGRETAARQALSQAEGK